MSSVLEPETASLYVEETPMVTFQCPTAGP